MDANHRIRYYWEDPRDEESDLRYEIECLVHVPHYESCTSAKCSVARHFPFCCDECDCTSGTHVSGCCCEGVHENHGTLHYYSTEWGWGVEAKTCVCRSPFIDTLDEDIIDSICESFSANPPNPIPVRILWECNGCRVYPVDE